MNKINWQCQGTDIEVLSKWLGSLKITKKDTLDKTRMIETETTEEVSTTSTPVVHNQTE